VSYALSKAKESSFDKLTPAARQVRVRFRVRVRVRVRVDFLLAG